MWTAATFALIFLQTSAVPSPAAPGKLVEAGGHRVHVYCTGEGAPAVVVTGGYSFDWALVQPAVAKFTRICTYDVAGTAWSDPGPAATCPDRTSELHGCLRNAGVAGPYVLVGFSVGGLVARYYATQFPGEVAGVVLVDHAFTPEAKAPVAAGEGRPVLLESAPLTFTTEETANFRNLPKEIQVTHRWAEARKMPPTAAEAADDCSRRLKTGAAGPFPLGEMPLVVVSTGNDAAGYGDLQGELLSLSHRARQMVAEKSFHSVEIDEPEVAIRAIREVVERVRRGR